MSRRTQRGSHHASPHSPSTTTVRVDELSQPVPFYSLFPSAGIAVIEPEYEDLRGVGEKR